MDCSWKKSGVKPLHSKSRFLQFLPNNTPSPVFCKFYKGRSQEKIHLRRLEFFLASQPTRLSRICSGLRATCPVAEYGGPAVWIFSVSGFHRLSATKPVSSETNKAERRSSGDHSSIGDSWPIAFSGYPRGPRVLLRLVPGGTHA